MIYWKIFGISLKNYDLFLDRNLAAKNLSEPG